MKLTPPKPVCPPPAQSLDPKTPQEPSPIDASAARPLPPATRQRMKPLASPRRSQPHQRTSRKAGKKKPQVEGWINLKLEEETE